MPDNVSDSEKIFYYNSGFQDGYHKATDRVREFLFETYTVPDWCLKKLELTDDNELG